MTESFQENLLEYPQYTRPEVWETKGSGYEAAKVLGYSRVQTFFRIIFTPGHQAGASGSDQRNDHAGKGYVSRLCADSNGDVYDCKADRSSTGLCNAADGSKSILLHF